MQRPGLSVSASEPCNQLAKGVRAVTHVRIAGHSKNEMERWHRQPVALTDAMGWSLRPDGRGVPYHPAAYLGMQYDLSA